MKRSNTLVRTGLAAAAAAGLMLAGPALAEGSGSAMEPGTHTGMHEGSQADQQLGAQVREKIQKEGNGQLDQVEVEADQGQVTLKGQVGDAMARQQAEKLARTVPGVSTVQNEIEIARQGGTSTGGNY